VARRRSGVRRAGAGRRIAPGLLLGVVLLVAALALVGVRAGRGPAQDVLQAGDDAAGAAGRSATGPARAGEDILSRLGAMWTSTERIQQLEDENRDLKAWRELAQRLAECNARYEALLRMPADAFGQGADLDSAIAAQLVLDSGGPFTRTLVANAGADHGVRIGYIAVNENGLVGRVVSVGRRTSRVLMLDDYNSRIPVMGEASRVRAVLAGQATRPPELLTGPYHLQTPRLDFIVGADDLREGERIITSGDGGLFPRGIPVGVAHSERDGSWRVQLAAAQRPIDFVRIIPFVGVVEPEAEAVADAGPPAELRPAVSAVGRDTIAPAPTTPTPPPVAPRRQAAPVTPSEQASPAPTPAPEPAQPPAAAPSETPGAPPQ